MNTEELQVFLAGHPIGSYLAVFKRVRGFWVLRLEDFRNVAVLPT